MIMKKRMVKQVSTAAMAGMMMTATLSMPVFADEFPKNLTLTKDITKEENVYAPNTTFVFEVRPGAAVPAGQNQDAVYAGIEGGVTVDDGIIASAPAVSDIGKTVITAGTTNLKVNESVFTQGENAKPGIYRYIVSETPADADGNAYEGVAYTREEKYFDVYVTYNSSGQLEVSSYAFVKTSDPKAKDDATFTNDYSSTHDTLHDLTVKKEVTGNQGNRSKDFEFTIEVDGAEGEEYYVTFSDQRAPITLVSGTAQTITLKSDQTAKVWGLSDHDTYTVTETDYTSDGYTTTIDGQATSETTGTIVDGAGTKDGNGDRNITVVNDKDTTTPGGIFLNVAPYMALLGAAIASSLLFFRRKRVKESDID